MPKLTTSRWAALAAGCALVVTALPSAAAQAEPTPGKYQIRITDAWIVDIQGKIDYDSCADVFGSLRVLSGPKDEFKWPWTYFAAAEKNPVEVCEPNRPLNEGAQVGHLRPNHSAWDKRQPVTLNNSANPQHKGWLITANLWDYDPVGNNDAICNHGKSEWIEPRETAHVWSCKNGDTDFNVSYEVDRIG